MRNLLDRPDLTDLVVADLSRMKDWSVQDRVVALYDTAPHNVPPVKRAILRYLMVSAKDGAQKLDPATNQWVDVPEMDLPAYVVKARKFLVDLEQRDPETTKQVKRFYNPQVPADRMGMN